MSAPTTAAYGTAAGGVVAGATLLTVRPLLVAVAPDPTAGLVVIFAVLLALGLAWPVARTIDRPPTRTVLAVGALGVGAFALGRLIGGGRAPAPFSAHLVALNSLAAVAEEAFFRRLAYDVLSPSGPLGAVAGTAVLFALVHVTVYGLWVLPLDLAAGLILGWQRHATAGWGAPAATHVLANVLMLA